LVIPEKKKLRVTGTHEAYGFQNESDIPKAGWGKKLPMILT